MNCKLNEQGISRILDSLKTNTFLSNSQNQAKSNQRQKLYTNWLCSLYAFPKFEFSQCFPREIINSKRKKYQNNNAQSKSNSWQKCHSFRNLPKELKNPPFFPKRVLKKIWSILVFVYQLDFWYTNTRFGLFLYLYIN